MNADYAYLTGSWSGPLTMLAGPRRIGPRCYMPDIQEGRIKVAIYASVYLEQFARNIRLTARNTLAWLGIVRGVFWGRVDVGT